MKPCVFTGSAVAIVTPFCGDGVDLEAFDRLIERQIQGGTDAIVVCGTTGEAATLSYNERMALIERCVRTVDRRVPVIAGSGTNSTASSIALSKAAQSAGVDALLTVTPYYNKASQSGLVQHFSAIADAVDIPVILYNVPSRTGVGCTAQTYQALAKHPNIGWRQGSQRQLRSYSGHPQPLPAGLHRLERATTAPRPPSWLLAARGVISVAANVVPREMHELTQLCLKNRFLEAGALQLKLHELIRALFCEVNPIPVKAAMELLGLCSGELRLPLCRMSERHLEQLSSALKPFRASV